MSPTALFVHVPVDQVFIVGGPGPLAWERFSANVNDSPEHFIECLFTLRTVASNKTFKRKLKIWTVNTEDNCGGFCHYSVNQFTATFCGKVISGQYQPTDGTGWFSLD